MSDQPEDPPVDEAVDPAFVSPEDFEGLPDRIRVSDDPDPDGVHEEPEIPPKENITELTPAEREQFSSLMRIGKRTKKVSVMGFPVVLSSLNGADEVRIGLAVKDYKDTQGYSRAYQAAVIGSAIRSTEGQSWDNTLEQDPDPDVLFEKKFRRALDLYPLVIQYIYNEVLKMEAEFAELAGRLGKL